MSVTLTNRDTATYVLTQNTASADGVTYSVAGGTLADYCVALARHSGLGVASKNSRHNLRFERRKIDAAGVLKTLSVDITVAVPNSGLFNADDVDDVLTGLANYFATEADTGNFLVGVNRA